MTIMWRLQQPQPRALGHLHLHLRLHHQVGLEGRLLAASWS